MKAMILAAGKGTRVRPITFSTPKPMIPLIRKPVMESIIELLRDHGVKEIVVNTSHLAPVIEEYFRDGDQFGVRMAYSFEGVMVDGELQGKALGSAGGMKKIQNFSGFFDETFIVLCGDAWIDLDLQKVYEFHKANGSQATIVLKEVPREEVYKYGVVKTDADGRILQFQEKPAVEVAVSNTINTGIYMFEPSVLDHIPDGEEFDIGGQLFPRLVEAGVPFYGVSVPFQWVDIGSVPDLWDATRLILGGGVSGFKVPGKEVKPGIWTGINVSIDWDKADVQGPVYIGSSTSIGDGAKIIGPAVIGSNCAIEPKAIVNQCIIEDYTRVTGLAHLEQKIVFGNKCISPSGESFDIAETDIGFVLDDARKELEMSEFHALIFDFAKEVGELD
ncbi:MAG: NDP-sugar synthase [Gammaproteobacteria bacterium]|nr:NDP-sugar synthase [Gammaproteobacteria bacterium]MBU1654487.1 NDP-sugar synthase [Gammaproteobacteria bacterium]MBU1960139.1 NDP-sugar synthase [Gammaproteobacteria bacterium]